METADIPEDGEGTANDSIPSEQLNLFAHVSRLYNSGFSSLLTSIFGWLAYFGLTINLIINPNFKSFISSTPVGIKPQLVWISLIIIGATLSLIVLYSHYRLLFFGRWIDRMAREFNLYDFAGLTAPHMLIFGINRRDREHYENWTTAELLGTALITILLLISWIAIIWLGLIL